MVCPKCGAVDTGPDGTCLGCGASLLVIPAAAAETQASASATVAVSTRGVAAGVASAEGPLTVGQAFGARYQILKVLGAGGMGVVYQAWDRALEVAVALKVIRPEILSDPIGGDEVERRFKRELLLARQVTHRNVVRIHDLGELDGIKYISMPFVEGQTMAALLTERGRLPLRSALDLVRQVAEGLQAAHDAGIVHRDLKPENVMIDADGRPVIMDFGISRTFGGGTTAGFTVAGAVVGTIEYMAPEQAMGQGVDQRADVYALGLIAYDLIAGRQRLTAATTPVVEMMQRLQQAPAPLRTRVTDAPAEVERILSRALDPDPAKRYQNVRELIADIDAFTGNGTTVVVVARKSSRPTALALALIALVVIAGAGAWLALRARAPVSVPAHEPVSVLVADFENRTGEDVFDGSVEQALTIALEGAPFISAYSRGSAQRIARQLRPNSHLDEATARLVSAREGIKVILAGSITRSGDDYDVSVRAIDPVIDTSQDKPLAAVTRRASGKAEVLKAVGLAAADVRTALGDTTPQAAKMQAAETFTAGSLEAMQAYARGQVLMRANDIPGALKSYQEAVKLDPQFGRAYAGMGIIYGNFKQLDKAQDAYAHALKHLDRMTEREKYRTLGGYYLMVARNYDQAIQNYENLVRLYPADEVGHGNLALARLNIGSVAQAVQEVRQSLAVYPKNRIQRYNYAMYSMYVGDYETAVEQGSQILKATPSFEYAYLPVGMASLAAGKVDAARDAYDRLERLSPLGLSLASLGKADLAMYFGRPAEALAVLTHALAADEQQKRSGERSQKYVALADAYLASGDRRHAIEAAEEATKGSPHEGVLFLAGQTLVAAGDTRGAQRVVSTLEGMLQRQTVAYARLISGEIAIQQGQVAQGIQLMREGQKDHDSWVSHFLLGKAYAEAGHYAEAVTEFDTCLKRSGEATDMLFYDLPTLRYLPAVYYWMGRTQEALGVSADARKHYERYLGLRTNVDTPDPLAADAQRRLGS